MILSVVEGNNSNNNNINNNRKLIRALVTRQLVEIRILLIPQNEIVCLARPREMCVSLLRLI
jgi:hypothetical protein